MIEGGCFSVVVVFKYKTSKLGEAVKLSFILTQSNRDEYLIKSLIEYLGCGNTSLDPRGTIDFKVTNFTNIVPFFIKYPLKGNKSLDFTDFGEVVRLMENKSHLTKEGLDKIKKQSVMEWIRIENNSFNQNIKFIGMRNLAQTYQEKDSMFECGFHSFQQSRSPFNIAFFIYALVYLLLDLEILLTFPFAVSEYVNNIYGLIITLGFITIITIGFVYELGKGALKIPSKQHTYTIRNQPIIHISYINTKMVTKNDK